ncbi:DNA polymerase III subunit delta [bacterium]|nr:DNA polymerase III subunit delta [bacterium]
MPKKRIYYTEFRRSLDSGSVKPVYFFTGAETFLKEEGIQTIIDKVLPPAERSMNFESLYAGTDVSGQEVKERAMTLPFIAKRRVILVRQAEKWRAGDLNVLDTYLKDPAPTTVLIISSQEERLKQTNWKNFANLTYHVECYPLFDNQVPAWVERRVGEHGKRIAREAVQLLIERVGQTLADIDNEINKLVNYIGQKPMIEAADIRAAAGHIRQNTMHELNLALGRADGSAAVRLVKHVLDEGIRPIQMLGAIAWHFRNLHSIRKRLDGGEDLDKIVGNIRNPQARREMQLQATTYSKQAFAKIFQELLKLDVHLKTGKTHWEMFLEMTILKICRQYTYK